jgi:ABC-type branched-subunit amino acid transport system permease subunit
MILKIAACILAASLMLIYLSPVVLKLREPALAIVVLVGVVMMFVDMWQSLKSKEQ